MDLIALLEDGRDGLRIVCTPRRQPRDNASYGYATVTGYASKVNNGTGIASSASRPARRRGWVFWCRRSASRTAATGHRAAVA